eukprot:1377334-Amorphochlora_amoeboformis.AAC.1
MEEARHTPLSGNSPNSSPGYGMRLPAQNLTGVRPSPFLPPSPWGGRPVPQGMPPGGMPPNNTGPNTAPQEKGRDQREIDAFMWLS